MKTKKINLNELIKELSPKQMKNITGGSGGCQVCSSDCSGALCPGFEEILGFKIRECCY